METEKKKLPLLVWIMGSLIIPGAVFVSYVASSAGFGAKPSFIETSPFYLGTVLIIALTVFLFSRKNWARTIFIAGLYILGIFLIYLSWDFIRTFNPFFDDEIIKLFLGVVSLGLGFYLNLSKKVREVFN